MINEEKFKEVFLEAFYNRREMVNPITMYCFSEEGIKMLNEAVKQEALRQNVIISPPGKPQSKKDKKKGKKIWQSQSKYIPLKSK